MIPNIEVNVSQLAPNNPGLEDASFAPLEDDMGQSSYIVCKCLNGVLVEEIQKVTKLLDLKKELCILCKFKIKSLKLDESIVSNKLLGIKYNFQDRKTTMEEAQVELAKVEHVLSNAQQQGQPTMELVCHRTHSLDCFFLGHISLHLIITNNLLQKVYVDL